MNEQEPLDIFLSYARDDAADLVARFDEDLRAASRRFRPWFDRQMPPDQPWDRVIERGLSTADVMIVVLTEASPDRDWCRDEILWARRNEIPIVVAQMHAEVADQLALISRTPFDFAAGYDAALARLVAYLNGVAKSGEQVESPAAPSTAAPARDVRRRRRMRFVNAMPEVPSATFHDHVITLKRLDEDLSDPAVRLILLTGRGGIGKTAMLAEVRRRLAEDDFDAPADGFVYFATAGYRRVTATGLLSDLAEVVADPDEGVRLARRLLAARPWRESLDDVLTVLGGTAVVVAIDDVDALLGEDGRIRDADLRQIVSELVRRDGHGVRLLLTGRRGSPALDRDHRPHVRVCPLDEGLPYEETEPFLRGLDAAGALAGADLPEADLRRLSVVSGGNPRFLELTYCLLALDPSRTLHAVLAEIAPRPDSAPAAAASALLWRILARLKRRHRRVVQTLAVFGRPVPAGAVDEVLRQFIADPQSAAILDRLAHARLVRRDGDRFFLPPDPDAAAIRETIEPGTAGDGLSTPLPFTRQVLLRLAAAVHRAAAERSGAATGPDDLADHFSEIELRIEAHNHFRALEVMEAIDKQYLTKWGQSDVLLPWRRQLVGEINDNHLEAHNLSYLVAARDEEDHTGAWTLALRTAAGERFVGRRPRDRTRLQIQLADLEFDNGRLALAARLYRRATWRCGVWPMPYEEAMARTGRGLALARQGAFRRARREFATARWLAAAVRDDEDRREVLTITLLNEGWLLGQLDETSRALDRLAEGQRAAAELGSAVLTGQLLDGRAALLCDRRQAEEAIRLAREAAEIGMRTANSSLSREANVTLGLAYLLAEDPPNALAATEAAVNRAPSMRALGAWAVHGVALYRTGRTDRAGEAFHRASTEALLRLDRAPAEYAVHHAMAICLVGLELCGETHRLSRAIDAFATARRIARAPGAGRRSETQLALFGPAADRTVIEVAQRAARGDIAGARTAVRP